jgi:hypothetical protein
VCCMARGNTATLWREGGLKSPISPGPLGGPKGAAPFNGSLFLIQSTHHQLPRTQAPSGKSQLAALHDVHAPHPVRAHGLLAVGVLTANGQNINSGEWFVWREIYFSHRQTTFSAWLLVDSHPLNPHTPPCHYHHQVPPKKVAPAKSGAKHLALRYRGLGLGARELQLQPSQQASATSMKP